MTSEDNKNIIETRPSLRYTIPPSIQTKIAVKTIPDGVCTVGAANRMDFKQSVRLHADHDGVIVFHVKSPKESELVKLVIYCDTRGKITQFPIELRVNSTPTRDAPCPPSDLPRPSTHTTTLPALSEEDMLRVSRNELIKRGYPPRPDPIKAQAFNRWRKIVSKSITLIEPHLVVTDISHRPTKSNLTTDTTAVASTWCGAVVRGNQFTSVYGEWTLPGITTMTPGSNDCFSCWIGIDGWDGGQDIVQTGTDCQVQMEDDGTQLAKYSAWYEFYTPTHDNLIPFDDSEILIEQGNEITAFIETESERDPNVPYPGNNVYISFTSTERPPPVGTGKVTVKNVKLPITSPPFTGNTAEWIIECNVKGSTLANYGSMDMSNCKATMKGSHQIIQPYHQKSVLITMTDNGYVNGNVLSNASFQGDPGEITFKWFRPGPPSW